MLAPAAVAEGVLTKAYLANGKNKYPAVIVQAVRPGHWVVVDCIGYSGAEVVLGPRRRAITVHYIDGTVAGFALVQRDGRWAIYRGSHGPGKLIGFAVRQAVYRWNVLQGDRKGGLRMVGHTVGPDGPAAATLLVTIC